MSEKKMGMKQRVIRLTAAIMTLMLICGAAMAEDNELSVTETVEETVTAPASATEETAAAPVLEETAAVPVAEAPVASVTPDGYQLDAEGFLTGENPGPAYILEDEEKGLWQYASKTLAVTIRRTREKVKKKTREYCVADIRTREANPVGAIMTEPYARFGGTPTAGKRQDTPETLMNAHPSVLAMSDDMYGLRIIEVSKKKTKYDFHGVVIRDGEVMATKTRKSPEEGKKDKRPWPNLDTMAVYRDGSMKTYVSDALTAEEYLEQGALHVFAFGPWLISDGEINPAVLNPKYYPSNEPRLALGMVEPRHYIAIAVAGRPNNQYAGVHLDWLAEKMKEYGCTEALNLDGGATVVMAFMNKAILRGDMSSKKGRNVGSLIAWGLDE